MILPAGPSSPAPARERLTVVGADVRDGTGRGVIRPRMSTVPGAAETISYWLFIGDSPVGA